MTAEITLRHLPDAFPLERERDREGWRVVSMSGDDDYMAFRPGDFITHRQLAALKRNGWKVTIT